MNEFSPKGFNSRSGSEDGLGSIARFELPTDENALDPTQLSDSDIVGAFMSHAGRGIGPRPDTEVARIVNGLLGPQEYEFDVNTTRSAWHHETLIRITEAEQLVSEDDTYEDPIVGTIVRKLRASAPRAEDFKEQRAALRHLIDLRTVVIATPDMITDENETRWNVLIDKLYRED